jgi:hypothetical protein
MRVTQIHGSPFITDSILTKSPHESESLAGWLGLATWIVADEKGDLWDVDWRYAFGSEIFKQHWIDFGWDENKLLHRLKRKEKKRHKAIVYICAPEMVIPENYSGLAEFGTNKTQETAHSSGLLENPLWHPIPERYLLGKYWQSIYRCLIPLAKLPQELQELLPETLPTASENPHGDYSTTRNLQQTPPKIINSQKDEVCTVLALPPHPNRKGEGGLRTKELFKHPGSEDKPLISVITVVLNNVALLEQTMQSVINQSSDRVQYIVIDGGSTDRTFELIQQYDEQIDYWVSEPDEGIYDAMNMGLELSLDWCLFINAGDLLMPQFSQVNIQGDAVVGYSIIVGNKLNWCRPLKNFEQIERYSHQSFISKKKFYFNTDLMIAADTDMMKKYISFNMDRLYISIFRLGGVSSGINLSIIIETYRVSGVMMSLNKIIKWALYAVIKDNIQYFQYLKQKYL